MKTEYQMALMPVTLILLISLIFSCQLFVGCGTTTTVTIKPGNNRLRAIPQNAEFLFLSNRDTGDERMEIYARDAQGNITRITNTGEPHFLYGIDNSRRYIVATRGSDNLKRLWLLDLQTGKETPLTGEKDNAEGRSFSPDGEWIVFWMVQEGEKYSDIYKIRRDGSGLVDLTGTPLASELDPCWSNDGDSIAFNYNDGQPNRFILKIMDADGTGARTVYDPADAAKTTIFPPGVYDPSWSLGSDRILVEKPVKFSGSGENGGAGVWHIIQVSVDGNTIRDLTGTGELAGYALYLPSFSGDGKRIIMSARYDSENSSDISLDIIKMDADGSNAQKVTESPYWEQFPVWLK
jgi:Tol biopolymer transport system component